MKKERTEEELMELVKELADYFKRHSLRDYENRKKFLEALAIAELEKECAANEQTVLD